MKKVSVIFVCLGNICRSPTAHAVFRQKVKEAGLEDFIEIDSAGTAAYHVGKPADARSREIARNKGIEMEDLRARKVDLGDLIQFDYVLAMDEANYADLMEMALSEDKQKIQFFLDYATDYDEYEVPDPYYGGDQGFERVFEMIESASNGLLEEIEQKYIRK